MSKLSLTGCHFKTKDVNNLQKVHSFIPMNSRKKAIKNSPDQFYE